MPGKDRKQAEKPTLVGALHGLITTFEQAEPRVSCIVQMDTINEGWARVVCEFLRINFKKEALPSVTQDGNHVMANFSCAQPPVEALRYVVEEKIKKMDQLQGDYETVAAIAVSHALHGEEPAETPDTAHTYALLEKLKEALRDLVRAMAEARDNTFIKEGEALNLSPIGELVTLAHKRTECSVDIHTGDEGLDRYIPANFGRLTGAEVNLSINSIVFLGEKVPVGEIKEKLGRVIEPISSWSIKGDTYISVAFSDPEQAGAMFTLLRWLGEDWGGKNAFEIQQNEDRIEVSPRLRSKDAAFVNPVGAFIEERVGGSIV